MIKHLQILLCILPILLAGCGDLDSSDKDTEELPRQTSSIKVISDMIASGGERITLEYPKPFQTFNTLDVSGDITFKFSPALENGEIYIFSSRPEIDELRSGNTSGCLIGTSSLAGHYWHGTQVNLSATESQNQFYRCLSGIDLLSQTEKARLGTGDFYWFVMSYHSNFLISKSSDVRMFTIE